MNLLSDVTVWKHSLQLAGIQHQEDLTVEIVSRKVFVQVIPGEGRPSFVSHTNPWILKEKPVSFKNVDISIVN